MNKKNINISTHAMLRYGQRFCRSNAKLADIAKSCRQDLISSHTFGKSMIEPYLKKITNESHKKHFTKKIVKQEFERCHIYKNRVFIEKDNNIVTIISVSQFIVEDYIAYLNSYITEGFEIIPDKIGIV